MILRNLWLSIKERWNKSSSVAKFCVHLSRKKFVYPCLTQGPSMLPTIDATFSIVLAERISNQFDKVSRGDIVILGSPQIPDKMIVKRLLGLEGDRIRYLVNPKVSKTHFRGSKFNPKISCQCKTVVIPKGHVWVQGDNIYNSIDSRQFGPVPYDLLQGKVFWRVWPLRSFGPLGKK